MVGQGQIVVTANVLAQIVAAVLNLTVIMGIVLDIIMKAACTEKDFHNCHGNGSHGSSCVGSDCIFAVPSAACKAPRCTSCSAPGFSCF